MAAEDRPLAEVVVSDSSHNFRAAPIFNGAQHSKNRRTPCHPITYFYPHFNGRIQDDIYPGAKLDQPNSLPTFQLIPRSRTEHDAARQKPRDLLEDNSLPLAVDADDVLLV